MLCAGKTTPHEDLCAEFDKQTKDGSDMALYDRLLRRCVDAIVATFQRRMAAGLQQDRGFLLPTEDEQVNDLEDFELVTWLVVKGT